jgi:hypothetical protein
MTFAIDWSDIDPIDMIAGIVGALDQRESFRSLIRHTGRRYARFGTRSSHFAAFGEAATPGLILGNLHDSCQDEPSHVADCSRCAGMGAVVVLLSMSAARWPS